MSKPYLKKFQNMKHPNVQFNGKYSGGIRQGGGGGGGGGKLDPSKNKEEISTI